MSTPSGQAQCRLSPFGLKTQIKRSQPKRIPPPLVGLQRLESTGRDSRTGALGGRQPPCVLGRVQLLDRPLLITPHPLPGPPADSPV